jgi:hypothetical protein
MSRDTTVLPFRQREAIDDPLSELAREGARRMLAQVLIAEADSFVAMWKDLKLPDGRDRVVRHGHGPHRAIQTGVGPVEVRRAKVRDRGDVGAEEKIRFTSFTECLCREGVSQPAGGRKMFKYLPRRPAIPSLVVLKAAKFGTYPALEAPGKFKAGRIKEGPGQMAQIHRASIKGRKTMVNPKPNVRVGSALIGNTWSRLRPSTVRDSQVEVGATRMAIFPSDRLQNSKECWRVV